VGDSRMLAKWANRQRSRKTLSGDQITALNGIGFDWLSKPRGDDKLWDQMYARLVRFRERFGDCLVPQQFQEDRELGNWVANQRRRRKKYLRKDREEKLNSIGFVWVTKPMRNNLSRGSSEVYDNRWNDMFQRLQSYKQVHGDCNVPYNYLEDQALALWVTTQRRENNQKSWYGTDRNIRKDRKNLLDNIGFHWRIMAQKRGKDDPIEPPDPLIIAV